MKGIDVYQGESKNGVGSALKATPEKAYKESDFVIVKATQGTSYKYTEFFNNMIKRTLADGKLGGAYHYAAGNDATKEADYFVSIVKPYVGKIILVLDWESIQNKSWGSTTWAKKFVDRVKERTGVTCFLYTGSDGCKQCSNLIGVTPLWFAGYPKPQKTNWTIPTFKYDLGKWKNYAIWQYTSSNEVIDRNTTNLTRVDWLRHAGMKESEIVLTLLAEYSDYIKAHAKYFYRNYDGTLTTFAKAKALADAKKKVGITCVVPLRWALAEMGLKNSKGTYLISGDNGSFGSYYSGDMKLHLTKISSGTVIGLTVKQAIDKKLLKPGDIICYKAHTHTSVYSGDKYNFFEGGSQSANKGFVTGVKINYEKYGYKISEILRWKETGTTTTTSTTTTTTTTAKTSTKSKYTGEIPALPPRGYYMLGDGITTLKDYPTQIKRVQKALNFALTGVKGFKALTVDSKFGMLTRDAVKLYQKTYKLTVDGLWGKQCNSKLKTISK